MSERHWWFRLVTTALVLGLGLSLAAACGGDDEAASFEPARIGAITSWTGPMAMAGTLGDQVIAVVEDQVKAQGGVNGHPLEIVRFDEGGQTAQAMAGVTKLVSEDKVKALVWGGGTPASCVASSDKAEELKVPLFSVSSAPSDISQLKYTIRAGYVASARSLVPVGDLIIERLKPRTVAILADSEANIRERVQLLKQRMAAAGIDVVYEEYVPQGTTDLSPHLTRIKYERPDLLVLNCFVLDTNVTLFRQIAELGGWGGITVVSGSAASSSGNVLKLPAAQGTYHYALWAPGLDTPGSLSFEDAFMVKYGSLPTPTHTFFYMALWTAIKAMELAGTTNDSEAIALAARSGNLKWDSPAGSITFDPDGEMTYVGRMFRVSQGSLIEVK